MGITSFSPWNLQQVNSPAGQKAGATDAPAAAGDPVASVFGSQQHIAYPDTGGAIHDCWYDGTRGRWNHQQINGAGGVTSGPPAAGGPFVWTVGAEQQHFTYRGHDGVIYDSWFAAGQWNLRHINGPDGLTSGPAASGNPFASVFGNQHHVGYRDAAGLVYDSWCEGSTWNLRQINGTGGCTRGSPARGGPYIWTVGADQQHFTYYDTAGTIHDAWWTGEAWKLRHINGAGGLTDGPRAAGLPCVSVYGDQQHVFYQGRVPDGDRTGIIHDAWYDGAKDRWSVQQINGTGGMTAGPAAAGSPAAGVFSPRPLSPRAGQHVAYRDSAGALYNCWFDTFPNSWNLEQVTTASGATANGATAGPAASGGPFVWSAGASQQHFTYRTADGAIYDAWFNGAATGRLAHLAPQPSGAGRCGSYRGRFPVITNGFTCHGSMPRSFCARGRRQHLGIPS
jgi:hypothetical protein